MARKRTKGVNGVGTSITLRFDESDPLEAAALAMSQLLASKHGRRKDAIVAFLAAAYQHYESTGKLLTTADITTALQPSDGRPTTGLTLTIGQPAPAEPPRTKRPQTVQDAPTITMTTAKTRAADVHKNFLAGMAGFLD